MVLEITSFIPIEKKPPVFDTKRVCIMMHIKSQDNIHHDIVATAGRTFEKSIPAIRIPCNSSYL